MMLLSLFCDVVKGLFKEKSKLKLEESFFDFLTLGPILNVRAH